MFFHWKVLIHQKSKHLAKGKGQLQWKPISYWKDAQAPARSPEALCCTDGKPNHPETKNKRFVMERRSQTISSCFQQPKFPRFLAQFIWRIAGLTEMDSGSWEGRWPRSPGPGGPTAPCLLFPVFQPGWQSSWALVYENIVKATKLVQSTKCIVTTTSKKKKKVSLNFILPKKMFLTL